MQPVEEMKFPATWCNIDEDVVRSNIWSNSAPVVPIYNRWMVQESDSASSCFRQLFAKLPISRQSSSPFAAILGNFFAALKE